MTISLKAALGHHTVAPDNHYCLDGQNLLTFFMEVAARSLVTGSFNKTNERTLTRKLRLWPPGTQCDHCPG